MIGKLESFHQHEIAPGLRSAAPHMEDAERRIRGLLADFGLLEPDAPGARTRKPGSNAPPSKLERLHAAMQRADARLAGNLIPQLAPRELNTPVGGLTSLMRAASWGDAKVVKQLIEVGADPNARGMAQRTALQYAAEKNRLEAARLLLDAGADINGVDNGSLSPLVMAADRNYTRFALMLIGRGANVNIQNLDGWTALMDAAEVGNVKVVNALLEAGAHAGARHRSGLTALDFARRGKHQEVVRILERRTSASARIRTGTSKTSGANDTGTGGGALPRKKGERQ